MNILITGVGGPTPRSFARALTEFGKGTYKLFGTDINKYSIGLYQNSLFTKTVLSKPSSDPGYWEEMETIIRENNIDLAVILPEIEVVAWSKRQLHAALPCKALIPPHEVVEKVLDKGTLTEFIKELGVVPKTSIIEKGQPISESSLLEIGYPMWIRSSGGSSGLGSFLIKERKEIDQWMKMNEKIQRFVCSEYLPGRNLACKLLYFEGELIRTASAERVNYIMAKVSPSGITGNTSFGRLINDPNIEKIARETMEFVFDKTKVKPHGFYTVDFKEKKDGTPMITEINVRHVAFTQCFAAGGANLCEDTIDLLMGKDLGAFKAYRFEEGLIFLRDVDERPILMLESHLVSNN